MCTEASCLYRRVNLMEIEGHKCRTDSSNRTYYNNTIIYVSLVIS